MPQIPSQWATYVRRQSDSLLQPRLPLGRRATALFRLYTVWGLAVLTCVGGCGPVQDAPETLPVAPAPRPRAEIAGGSLTIEAPGHGWRLLRGEDAEASQPGAEAVVTRGAGCLGWARRTQPRASSTREHTRALLATLVDDSTEVRRDEDVLYNTKTARRIDLRRKLSSGDTIDHRLTVFLADGYAYEIQARSTATNYPERRRCLSGAMRAFTLR